MGLGPRLGRFWNQNGCLGEGGGILFGFSKASKEFEGPEGGVQGKDRLFGNLKMWVGLGAGL